VNRPEAQSALPLDGLLVADFSRVLAGPLACAMLADLGARVVKVERPGTGDDTRHWGPPWTASSSAYFESANRSKQSIQLDLDDPDDRATAVELALAADVLVENFRTGTLERRQLGYEQLALRNPRLVYCSVTGFGSGAGAPLPGYDFLVQAVGGLMSITGAPDGEPQKAGVALVDVLTSKDAVMGILAALHERSRSGRGQRVEVNLLSSSLAAMVNQASSYLTTGTPPGRMGNRHPSIAPYETLRCQAGKIAVCCGNDSQFARLTEQLGIPFLATDERFATNPARVAHREALVEWLEKALSEHVAEVWAERLGRAGVPAGVVGDLRSGIQLAQSLGLRPTADVGSEHPRQMRHPVDYSRTPVTSYRPPPDLGEHDDAVRNLLTEMRKRS
jgi:crotonobetainyl-CoA:carnitine CoA-transferase CaiB-like acyl-CoA transferase